MGVAGVGGTYDLGAGKHLRGHNPISWIRLPRSSQTLGQQESQTLEVLSQMLLTCQGFLLLIEVCT